MSQRITVSIDVPTSDLADRLANLTVNFSPKKERGEERSSGKSKDARAPSKSSAPSEKSSAPSKKSSAPSEKSSAPSEKSSAPSEKSEASNEPSVDCDSDDPKPKRETPEPWKGEAWVVLKGRHPGVYATMEDRDIARGKSLYGMVRYYRTYEQARRVYDEAHSRGETRVYSKSWDEESEHGLPPRRN
ncbi:hypothetical protein FA95DRAFT_1613528 [Auriscalpium vulgare]|uniref:Uncharacterized protein n=1 Tax=Auriscalpium vulgare TaxID=40419 RepID=A0ACB8R2N8_9AGAM|nr:hypothetical protein FA95DRAFT_1613528 [Auriscalpium vulgare]